MNVIVTGGGGDIGGACARLLAARGNRVLIVDSDADSAERLASEINERAGADALASTANVSLADDVRNYVATAVDAWGTSAGWCTRRESRVRPHRCRRSRRRSSTG